MIALCLGRVLAVGSVAVAAFLSRKTSKPKTSEPQGLRYNFLSASLGRFLSASCGRRSLTLRRFVWSIL